jgi:hypothetical protein
MSQTIVPPAPAGGPSAPSGPGGTTTSPGTLGARLASGTATVRHYLSGSPGRLRIVSGVAVLAAVLVALGGGAALQERSSALDEAKRSAAHLVLVQGVQINLVQANADVSNSFLKFGLEPVKQQLDFIDKIQAASRDLALAANASPEDAASLGRVNADLTRYAEYIGRARANNRSGNPVGANYLSTASDLLLEDVTNDSNVVTKQSMVSELKGRSDDDREKIESAYSRATHASWWLALVAIIGLGVLIWAQIYLARRSRRILNVPLAASTVGLLAALVVAAGAMAVSQSKANDVRDGSLANATALSDSRVAAFTAKSTESLTLINRGSATDEDKEWKAAITTATTSLGKVDAQAVEGKATTALAGYAKLHAAINAADVKGKWDDAVVSAVAPGSAGKPSANSQFTVYDGETSKALDSEARSATSDLGQAGGALLPAGILVVLIGLLAALGAWWGISLRLDEYR